MSSNSDRYTQIEACLGLADIEISASEVHGTLVGAMANHMKSGITPDLLALIEPGANKNDGRWSQLSEVLYETYREVSEQMLEAKESFDVLLPDDNEPLGVRAEGLATWTRGYLLGLLYNDRFGVDQLPESGAEITRDFMEIAEAGSGFDGDQEEDFALAELHEYVKVGSQLIFEFIYSERASEAPQREQ